MNVPVPGGRRLLRARIGARALATLAALAALPAAADDQARHLLDAMNQALASRNYQGEFLHLGHGPIEKLRIFHRVKDGHVVERLVSLSPHGREIVRHDGELQCFLPDELTVLVETPPDRGALLGAVPSFDSSVEENYRVELTGHARVLGRPTTIVSVLPRDGYRFGYRLWIDEENKMPLRTDLCDEHGQMLEQVLFNALEVDVQLPDSVFRSEVDATHFTWIRQAADPPRAAAREPAWQLLQLPPGFKVSSSGEQHLPGSDGPVTHLVLSDGLASVSVFIEGPPPPPRQPSEGQGRVGSAFAYSRFVAGHQVTAIGEVPAQTVEYIATGAAPGVPPKEGYGLVAGPRPRP